MRDITKPRQVFGKDYIKAIYPKIHWVEVYRSAAMRDFRTDMTAMAEVFDCALPVTAWDEHNLDRPYIKYGTVYCFLNLDRHNWLIERRIAYALTRETQSDWSTAWFVGFESKSDAALFKLTWR